MASVRVSGSGAVAQRSVDCAARVAAPTAGCERLGRSKEPWQESCKAGGMQSAWASSRARTPARACLSSCRSCVNLDFPLHPGTSTAPLQLTSVHLSSVLRQTYESDQPTHRRWQYCTLRKSDSGLFANGERLRGGQKCCCSNLPPILTLSCAE